MSQIFKIKKAIKSKTVSRSKLRMFYFVGIFVIFGFVALYITQAATPTTVFEPENGILNGTNLVADTTASGGKAIQFSAAAIGGVTCAEWPAFPNETCTGVPTGTTLHSCSFMLSTANALYDGCTFNGGITVNADGITIKNSKILGVVTGTGTGLKLMNVEIDEQNSDADAFAWIQNFTCIQCNIHHASKGIQGNNFTLIDSYIHDIYGSGSSHNEPILGADGNIVIKHSNLVGNFSSSSTGGGMSAAIALYTHATYWGPLNNVIIDKSRLESKNAYYCLYGGYSVTRNPTNITVTDNYFYINPSSGTCGISGGGPVIGWYRGAGNVWSGNMMVNSSGNTTPLAEPPSSPYN